MSMAAAAALLLVAALPAGAVTTNTLSQASTAGDGACGIDLSADSVVSSGTVSFDRGASRPDGGAACMITYGARAGGGAVGVGLTMTSDGTTRGDTVIVTARSQFDLAFDTTADWDGNPIDVALTTRATGMLSRSTGGIYNGSSQLEGFFFARGRRNATSISDQANLPTSTLRSTDPTSPVPIARDLTVTLNDIDPLRGITVILSLTGTVRGVGDFTLQVGALDSLGFVLGEQIIGSLPTGVTLRDDPTLGIVNGAFVSTIPLPPAGLALLAAIGALAARRRVKGKSAISGSNSTAR
ncbi:MAG: hypothetical protein AAFU70_09985 [Planctomycetota bacterium]